MDVVGSCVRERYHGDVVRVYARGLQVLHAAHDDRGLACSRGSLHERERVGARDCLALLEAVERLERRVWVVRHALQVRTGLLKLFHGVGQHEVEVLSAEVLHFLGPVELLELAVDVAVGVERHVVRFQPRDDLGEDGALGERERGALSRTRGKAVDERLHLVLDRGLPYLAALAHHVVERECGQVRRQGRLVDHHSSLLEVLYHLVRHPYGAAAEYLQEGVLSRGDEVACARNRVLVVSEVGHGHV